MMNNNLTYSPAGYALTERFEGLRLQAYQDQGGVWTIGYGHTGKGVTADSRVTQQQALVLLKADLAAAVACVNHAVSVPLQQCEFDALVDFAFNVGGHKFLHSDLLNFLNADRHDLAAKEFALWNHVGGVVSDG